MTDAEKDRNMTTITTPACPSRSCGTSENTQCQSVQLTIVLPALNEEEAIASTIERCLQARARILAESPVTSIKVVVVNDGSTDRTAEIASSFEDVPVINFARNRGYGAAIKEGWRQGGGDLLAFLDADGTCDPTYFIEMCRIAVEEQADVVLGCRMGPDSKMPPLRRLGNQIFAGLLGLLSRRQVTDSASGMRVIRASSLAKLLPLPNGLDFTPSMSARALMDRDLTVREIPMQYAERIGQSKLSVLKDGLRFAREIFSAAVYIKPSRITLPVAAALSLVCILMSIGPIRHYWAHGMLPEWMVYRFLAMAFGGSAVITLLCATVIAEHLIALSQLRYHRFLEQHRSWWGRRALRTYFIASMIAVAVGCILIWPGVVSYLSVGSISPETMHWSRMIVAGFFLLTFWQMIATACILRIIPAMDDRQRFLISSETST
jgi:hypothetical protein